MSYSNGFGCGPGCGCSCRGRPARRSASCGLGERYLPDELRGLGAFGVKAPVPPALMAARRTRARIHAVKGKLAERIASRMPQAQLAMAEARARALREGIDPNSVKFTRNVKGMHHDNVPRQLTDGMIYGEKNGKIRIFNVFESKARSSVRDVAFRARKDLGQIARDFERLRQLPLRIDDRDFAPRDVLVSRNKTAWTVFSPRGTKPTAHESAEVRQRSGFDMRHVELPLTNPELEARATRFVAKRPTTAGRP